MTASEPIDQLKYIIGQIDLLRKEIEELKKEKPREKEEEKGWRPLGEEEPNQYIVFKIEGGYIYDVKVLDDISSSMSEAGWKYLPDELELEQVELDDNGMVLG